MERGPIDFKKPQCCAQNNFEKIHIAFATVIIERENEPTKFFRGALVKKKMILAATVSSSMLAVAASFFVTPVYESEVLLSPSSSRESGSGVRLASQIGGLAALAGVNLSGNDNKEEALATLASRLIAEKYILQENLLPLLLEGQCVDRVDKCLFFSPPPKDTTARLWLGTRRFLKEVRSVRQDKKTGLVTLSVEWKDPAMAAKWANDLVAVTNATLRDRAISDSTRNLRYLNDQLTKISFVETREVIFRLIEVEIKNIMLAQGEAEYAFKIIDPAVISQVKSKPQRALMAIFGGVLGLFVASAFALISAEAVGMNGGRSLQ